jgi:hypothetical protein
MDQRFNEWKLAIDRLWSAASSDYREIARVVAEIAGDSADQTLRQAATQALPSLRNASARLASSGTKEIARRRLSLVRNVLHALAAPRFGKRGIVPKPLSPEERYRQMLGLPLGRRLAASEIHQAYKRAAKTMHPDGGGNEQAFVELAAARDALMKEH